MNALGQHWQAVASVAPDGVAYTDRNHRRWELGATDAPAGPGSATAVLEGRSLQLTMRALVDYINATHARILQDAAEQKAKALQGF